MANQIAPGYRAIVEQYGEEYAFRQLAEEAAELTQAALKMVRVMNAETPVRWETAQDNLIEELADAQIMIDLVRAAVLDDAANVHVQTTINAKRRRMEERLLEGV